MRRFIAKIRTSRVFKNSRWCVASIPSSAWVGLRTGCTLVVSIVVHQARWCSKTSCTTPLARTRGDSEFDSRLAAGVAVGVERDSLAWLQL